MNLKAMAELTEESSVLCLMTGLIQYQNQSLNLPLASRNLMALLSNIHLQEISLLYCV